MSLKLLSQTQLAAVTLTDIFSVARQAQAGFVVKSLFVCCPVGGYATTNSFRLSLAKNGEADHDKQYLFYDAMIPIDSYKSELLIGLEAGDVLRAWASSADTTISLFGESAVL